MGSGKWEVECKVRVALSRGMKLGCCLGGYLNPKEAYKDVYLKGTRCVSLWMCVDSSMGGVVNV